MRKRAGKRASAEARRIRRAFITDNARVFASVAMSCVVLAAVLVAFEWWVAGERLAIFLAGASLVAILWACGRSSNWMAAEAIATVRGASNGRPKRSRSCGRTAGT